jgi:hypothetical protein
MWPIYSFIFIFAGKTVHVCHFYHTALNNKKLALPKANDLTLYGVKLLTIILKLGRLHSLQNKTRYLVF